jgi:hypothetical protein
MLRSRSLATISQPIVEKHAQGSPVCLLSCLGVTSWRPPPGGAQAAQSTASSTSFQNRPFLQGVGATQHICSTIGVPKVAWPVTFFNTEAAPQSQDHQYLR